MFSERFRRALMMVGGALLLCFLIPLCTAGIFNIGNLTGIVLFSLIALAGFYGPKLYARIALGRSRRLWKGLNLAVVAVLLLFVLIAAVETCWMIRARNVDPAPDSTVVVLGCQNGSKMMASRTNKATEYLTEHPSASCILSGGAGNDESTPEGEYMARILMENGIDPSRLYVESRSTSTRENLEYSLRLAREKGLNTNFAIVTNGFHEYRASLTAKKLGIPAGSVPAGTPWWLFPTFYVRELYGILYEVIL